MRLEWKDEYSVGVTKIDTQHKQLLELINQLRDCSNSTGKLSKTEDVLLGLVSYTMSHFADEERLMQEHNYPEYANHLEEHRKLIENVTHYIDDLKAGRGINTLSLGGFLYNWLMDHIVGTDRALGTFLNERGLQ